MAQANVDGRVKWYNRTRGFGFVSTRETPSRDVFVHHSAIQIAAQSEQPHGKYLVQGEYVTIDIQSVDKNEQGHSLTVASLRGFQGDKLICELERRRPTSAPAAHESKDDGFTTVKPRAPRAPRVKREDGPAPTAAPTAAPASTAAALAPAPTSKGRGRPRKVQATYTGPMPSQ